MGQPSGRSGKGRRRPPTAPPAKPGRKRNSGSHRALTPYQSQAMRPVSDSRLTSQADRDSTSPRPTSTWQRFINWFDHLMNGTSDLYGGILLPNDRDDPDPDANIKGTTVYTNGDSTSATRHQAKRYGKLERAVDPWKRKSHLLAQIADPDTDPRAALKLMFAIFRRKARKEYEMGRAGTYPWSPLIFVKSKPEGVSVNRMFLTRAYGTVMDKIVQVPLPYTTRTYPLGTALFAKLIPAFGPTGTAIISATKHLLSTCYEGVPIDPILKVPLATLLVERCVSAIPGIGPFLGTMVQADMQVTSILILFDVMKQMTQQDEAEGWAKRKDGSEVRMWYSQRLTILVGHEVWYPQAVRDLVFPP